MRILVVEDEKKVAQFIQQGLEEEGYTVDVAYDGEQGLKTALEQFYNVIILDVMLPKKDGFQVVRELRGRKSAAPVLMLTAKDSVQNKVDGLDSGADDYLTKPFAFAELLARIRSLIRRRQDQATILKVADLSLNTVTHKAKRQDKDIELTGKEYALLEFFMRNKNRVLSRATIVQHVWNYDFDTGTNIIDVYINHLRSKVDGEFKHKLLHTVRGVGYVMKEE
jgi:heavy metal response regulator